MKPDDEAPHMWQQSLVEHPVFQVLRDSERHQWLDKGSFSKRAQSRYLARCGDMLANVTLILRGAVRINVRRKDGRELLLKILVAPALFGELEAFLDGPTAASVSTIYETSTFEVPAELFTKTMKDNGMLGLCIATDVARRLSVATSNEMSLAFDRVFPRLMRLLLDYTSIFPASPDGHVWLNVSQDQMAADLSVTRKSVNAALSHLRPGELVERKGNLFCLTDVTAAQAQAEGLPRLVHTMTTRQPVT